ncbi:MAG: hypothetical protein IJ538_04540 [Clostridia bacterium]|nr:hypothetical protein [Clostridia bacterium]
MQLPLFIQEKLKTYYSSIGKNKLTETRETLTGKYKQNSGTSQSLIVSKDESLAYAISRMPATYSVLVSLFVELKMEGFFENINSIADVGSGTGSGYFAIKSEFEKIEINLYEINDLMIQVFNDISGGTASVQKLNIITEKLPISADLVVSSYVLSELSNNDRIKAFQNLINSSNKFVLIVDTGTPKTYTDYINLIEIAEENNMTLVAPCCTIPCPLKNDYCAFYARTERSGALKVSKSAMKNYEDENYFYLLFCKDKMQVGGSRVIRRPVIKEGLIELKLCTPDGIKQEKVTRKNLKFKAIKKIKINEKI